MRPLVERTGSATSPSIVKAGHEARGEQINPHTPFGGLGVSGYGKEVGRAGIDEFLRYKTVAIA